MCQCMCRYPIEPLMLHEKERLVAAETPHPGDTQMPGMARISIKYFVLLLLTLQNVGAVLMMR